MHIDVAFPVRGEALPTDHYYALYASMTRQVRAFHDTRLDIRFAPISGEKGERGLIRPHERSRLRVRLPSELIGEVLPLAGRTLEVAGHSIHLGVPTVAPLSPVPLLAAKLVTFKHSTDPGRFLNVARQRLDEMGIGGEPGIPLTQKGGHAGEPRRQIIRVKGTRLIGFALQVNGLTAEESVRLQEQGLGGKKRIGCGFFVPYRPRLS
jgi:CRISPR-associated protein Cas6